jgi:hypothetical protein
VRVWGITISVVFAFELCSGSPLESIHVMHPVYLLASVMPRPVTTFENKVKCGKYLSQNALRYFYPWSNFHQGDSHASIQRMVVSDLLRNGGDTGEVGQETSPLGQASPWLRLVQQQTIFKTYEHLWPSSLFWNWLTNY